MSLSVKIISPFPLPWLPGGLTPKKDVLNNSEVTVRTNLLYGPRLHNSIEIVEIALGWYLWKKVLEKIKNSIQLNTLVNFVSHKTHWIPNFWLSFLKKKKTLYYQSFLAL